MIEIVILHVIQMTATMYRILFDLYIHPWSYDLYVDNGRDAVKVFLCTENLWFRIFIEN